MVILVSAAAAVAALLGLAAGLVIMGIRSARTRRAAERAADREALLAELTAQRDQSIQAAVSSAVDSVAVAAAEQLGQHTRSTVDTVLAVATDKLGSEAQAAGRELGLRHQAFERQIAGMNSELQSVRQLVAQLQRERAEQHGQLVEGLEQAMRASTALTDTTQSLREALSNSRARGQWGERMADDILKVAGLVEGVNYLRQRGVDGGGRPDVTFLLPQDRVLHMDVKFPLDNYMRALDATTPADTETASKAFLKDVRARVKELTGRQYTDPDTTVGYVLLFIPNEAVYGFVHENDPGLLEFALSQRVVLCSPFTLFAVLAVVRQSVDTFAFQRTSDEILQALNGFTKQWLQFTERLDRLGKQLGMVDKTFEELSGTRRRMLERELDRVEAIRIGRGRSGSAAATAGGMDETGSTDEQGNHHGDPACAEAEPADPADELSDAADPMDEPTVGTRLAVGQTGPPVLPRIARLRPIRGR